MTRPLRIEYEDAVYHVMARGNAREAIFIDDVDRQDFLTLLGRTCQRFSWRVFAYCLMGNHYHLLIQTEHPTLSRGMRQLNGIYTQAFNRRHQRIGHLFQGRYKALLVDKEAYLLELNRYIVLNPVKARLATKAGAWGWSSYRHMATARAAPEWLDVNEVLALFSPRISRARRQYAHFVQEGIKHSWAPDHVVEHQVVIGSEAFVTKCRQRLREAKQGQEIPRRQRLMPTSLKDYDRQSDSRNAAIQAAWASGAYRLKEIGLHFGLHYSTVSRIVNDDKYGK